MYFLVQQCCKLRYILTNELFFVCSYFWSSNVANCDICWQMNYFCLFIFFGPAMLQIAIYFDKWTIFVCLYLLIYHGCKLQYIWSKARLKNVVVLLDKKIDVLFQGRHTWYLVFSNRQWQMIYIWSRLIKSCWGW